MTARTFLLAACAALTLGGAAQAQGYKMPDQDYGPGRGYDRGPESRGQENRGAEYGQRQGQYNQGQYNQGQERSGAGQATNQPQSQGFNFRGDEMPPAHDPRFYGRYDDRYSQTYQQQQAEARKPGGGCLRYGAVGAAGGHLAGHGVLGAVAGCAVGSMVRSRDRTRIEQESGRQ